MILMKIVAVILFKTDTINMIDIKDELPFDDDSYLWRSDEYGIYGFEFSIRSKYQDQTVN